MVLVGLKKLSDEVPEKATYAEDFLPREAGWPRFLSHPWGIQAMDSSQIPHSLISLSSISRCDI